MWTLINRYLMLDPESRHRLKKLEGKQCRVIFLSLDWECNFQIKNNELTSLPTACIPDVIIKGTPLAILQVSFSRQNRRKLFAEDVTIEGNLELGQQLIDLLDEMEIDWEEYFAKWVGDVPANQVGNVIRRIKSVSHRLGQNFREALSEFLHEEVNFMPPSEALADFYFDVDQLRMESDRMEARVKRIQNYFEDKKL